MTHSLPSSAAACACRGAYSRRRCPARGTARGGARGAAASPTQHTQQQQRPARLARLGPAAAARGAAAATGAQRLTWDTIPCQDRRAPTTRQQQQQQRPCTREAGAASSQAAKTGRGRARRRPGSRALAAACRCAWGSGVVLQTCQGGRLYRSACSGCPVLLRMVHSGLLLHLRICCKHASGSHELCAMPAAAIALVCLAALRPLLTLAQPFTCSLPCQVVVHNLPWDCTWQQLKDAFIACGDIERADVVFDSRGRSRCASRCLVRSLPPTAAAGCLMMGGSIMHACRVAWAAQLQHGGCSCSRCWVHVLQPVGVLQLFVAPPRLLRP